VGGRYRSTVPGRAGPPVRGQSMLGVGDSLEVVTPGAGGYGPPRERDPVRVRRDLEEGKISARTAREIHGLDIVGVVAEPEISNRESQK
jgi:N-methylhydantoinase B/oxoprolinase/acetone carboxylase alpha subunit